LKAVIPSLLRLELVSGRSSAELQECLLRELRAGRIPATRLDASGERVSITPLEWDERTLDDSPKGQGRLDAVSGEGGTQCEHVKIPQANLRLVSVEVLDHVPVEAAGGHALPTPPVARASIEGERQLSLGKQALTRPSPKWSDLVSQFRQHASTLPRPPDRDAADEFIRKHAPGMGDIRGKSQILVDSLGAAKAPRGRPRKRKNSAEK